MNNTGGQTFINYLAQTTALTDDMCEGREEKKMSNPPRKKKKDPGGAPGKRTSCWRVGGNISSTTQGTN